MLRCNICGFTGEDEVVLDHMDDEHRETFFEEMFESWKNDHVDEVYEMDGDV